MPHWFNSPSNSLKKDKKKKAPSSVSVMCQLINPLNCPLEIPEEVDLAAGVGPFSAEGVVPNLLQKTWVAGILKVD
jgi:hypothetical protein